MAARSRFTKSLIAVCVVAALVLVGMGTERVLTRGERSSLIDTVVTPAVAQEQPTGNSIPDIIARDVPAVVQIAVQKTVQVQVPSIFNDPFFRQFFGQGFQVPRSEQELERFRGSGVIISEDGYILTNNHVVTYNGQPMDEVEVILPPPDGRHFNAKIVGTDARTEVAVVKINAKGLPTIKLGDSARLRLGDTVLAIGYPFDVGITVTEGIVSGLAKRPPFSLTSNVYVDFIQTDAAINPGNSGGALISARGDLVGINTLIVSTSGSFAGIGFAIPIDEARIIMNDIIEHGSVQRGFLGVRYNEVTADNYSFFGLKKPLGVIISEVEKGSPADKSGLEENDVITGINGKPITDFNQVAMTIGSMHPGEKVTLDVMRDKKEIQVSTILGKTPSTGLQKASRPRAEKAKPELALLNGVGIEDLNADYREQLGLSKDVQGVVVTDLDQSSPAADAGLAVGDVIQEVDLKPVADLDQFNAALKGVKADKILLTVLRNNQRLFITIKQGE